MKSLKVMIIGLGLIARCAAFGENSQQCRQDAYELVRIKSQINRINAKSPIYDHMVNYINNRVAEYKNECPLFVTIHSELPAGKSLLIENTNIVINPGDKVPVFAGEKVILKDSPNDYIKINSIGSGGDEKHGRLMSVCDPNFRSGNIGECSVQYIEQENK